MGIPLGRVASLGLDGHLGFVALRRLDASTEPRQELVVRNPRIPGPPIQSDTHAGHRFGMLTSFPPTACGIATFSAALAAGLIANGATVDVVRCGEAPELEDAAVLGALTDRTPSGLAARVDVLNRADVVIVQHEYGLYAGPDGDELVTILRGVDAPTIVVAHTVLRHPTRHQRVVLEEVCAEADAVVVMTESARRQLADGFDVDADKVGVIAHGAATPSAASSPPEPPRASRPARILTWGLLGPGKGIEWALEALARLDDLDPTPTYLVAGATHPKVAARSGEAYRQMLMDRAAELGISGQVAFDDTYRDLEALGLLIESADLVVLPYDSADQVTSGVLVDAVAAGRPVVSTAFPHAVELLASGAGLVVPQRDPHALADAIRTVIEDPERAASMAAVARRLAPDLSWIAVASRYDELASRLVAASAAVRP
jgi:glycosyltransferase involved in cell wall biosynthesis